MRSGDNKSLLERMDHLVLWSGIPRLNEFRVRRRPLRWMPIMALALASAGFIAILLRPGSYWIGYSILMVGFAVGSWLPIFGPVSLFFPGVDNVDERERSLRRDALLVGCATISFMVLVGLFILMLLTVLQDWPRGTLLRAMLSLALYAMVLYSSVPTLYASWAMPRPVDDDA